MKTNQLLTSMLAVSALLVTSCSTSKLARNGANDDDVYLTTARAKEYIQAPVASLPPVETTENTNQAVDEYYGTSDPYYDMDYSTRINRFYYASPWRTYYDGFYGYGYANGFYDPFYDSYFGMYNVWNPFFGPPFGSGFYYGSYWNGWGPGFWRPNYWGPVSWGGYYGGYPGGGYYGSIGGGIVRNNANYGPRPTRGSENGINRTGFSGGMNNGIPDRMSSGNSRAERYNPNNNAASSNSGRTSSATPTSSTPSRGSAADSRPTRSNDAPTRSTYTPPAQSSPPPSSSRGSSGSSSSSGGGSSSSSGGGRPTRGGGM